MSSIYGARQVRSTASQRSRPYPLPDKKKFDRARAYAAAWLDWEADSSSSSASDSAYSTPTRWSTPADACRACPALIIRPWAPPGSESRCRTGPMAVDYLFEDITRISNASLTLKTSKRLGPEGSSTLGRSQIRSARSWATKCLSCLATRRASSAATPMLTTRGAGRRPSTLTECLLEKQMTVWAGAGRRRRARSLMPSSSCQQRCGSRLGRRQ